MSQVRVTSLSLSSISSSCKYTLCFVPGFVVDRPQRPYDLLGLPSASPEIPAEAKVAEIEVPLTVPVQTHKQALFGVGAGNGDGDGEYRNQISSPVSPSLSRKSFISPDCALRYDADRRGLYL